MWRRHHADARAPSSRSRGGLVEHAHGATCAYLRKASRAGGVLQRQGHTEAAVDLGELAGRRPAGVLCELRIPDGSMARGAQVAALAARHGPVCTTVEAVRRQRLALGPAVSPASVRPS